MDSGRTFHSRYYRDVMGKYIGKVRLVDYKSLDITGIGDVVLNTALGENRTLQNVKNIPDLERIFVIGGI